MPPQETKRITLIAAMSEKDRVIGKDNALPWKIYEDMNRFRRVTEGQTVVMGRKTFESIGHPLPKRTNVIITRDMDFKAEGCLVTHSLEEALTVAREQGIGENIFVMGGGQIYNQALEVADRLDLTIVKGEFAGDVHFPDYSNFGREVSRVEREEGDYRFDFVIIEK